MKDAEKNPQISPQQLKQMMASSEMRQLLALLNRDGGATLRQAAQQFRSGDSRGAQELLRPLMEQKEAAELLTRLDQKNKER